MRKIRSIFVFLCALLLPASAALANSGPVYWEKYPHAELLAVEEGCPVEVLHEELHFDLTGGTQGSFGVQGRVTADYRMHNPASAREVGMAFPLIASPFEFNPADVRITMDGAPLAYELYIGQAYPQNNRAASGSELPEEAFTGYLSQISKEAYTPAHFSLAEEAVLYTFEVGKTSDGEFSFSVTFAPSDIFYIGEGMGGYGVDENGSAHFSSWIFQPDTYTVLAIGESPEIAAYTHAAYVDGERSRPTDAYTCEVREEKVVIGEYLSALVERFVRENMPAAYAGNAQMLSQLYSLALRSLDEWIGGAGGAGVQRALVDYDVMQALYQPYMLVLVYEAAFPAGGEAQLSVSYPVEGTMDSRDTKDPLHSFTYIFSPAAHWAAFGGLHITVETPAESPYILNSSLPFAQDGSNRYTAHSEALPGQPLRFSLYSSPEISKLDQAASIAGRALGPARPVVWGGAIVVVIALAAVLAARFRKKRREGQGNEDEK